MIAKQTILTIVVYVWAALNFLITFYHAIETIRSKRTFRAGCRLYWASIWAYADAINNILFIVSLVFYLLFRQSGLG